MTHGMGMSARDVSEELAGRLREVGRAVSPKEIGELWIFPPLPDVETSAEFLLFTCFLEEDRRRVYSARVVPAPRAEGNGHGANGSGPGANGDGPHANGAPGATRRAAGGEPALGSGDQRITEHGSVPADRVDGLVNRFRRRLGEDGEPTHLVIGGRRDRWAELLDGNGTGDASSNGGAPAGDPGG